MALQRKGIDCSFVNTISKLPSHHVKGASVLLAVVVQDVSRRKTWTLVIKCFNLLPCSRATVGPEDQYLILKSIRSRYVA